VGKGGAHGRSQPDHPALLALWRSRAWDEAIRNTEARNGSAVHQDLCERAAHSSAVDWLKKKKGGGLLGSATNGISPNSS
jgi:hypothetical protein